LLPNLVALHHAARGVRVTAHLSPPTEAARLAQITGGRLLVRGVEGLRGRCRRSQHADSQFARRKWHARSGPTHSGRLRCALPPFVRASESAGPSDGILQALIPPGSPPRTRGGRVTHMLIFPGGRHAVNGSHALPNTSATRIHCLVATGRRILAGSVAKRYSLPCHPYIAQQRRVRYDATARPHPPLSRAHREASRPVCVQSRQRIVSPVR
jgi:hypothetical protein